MAWLRIPACNGCVARAVYGEGPDVRCARAGRSRAGASAAPCARNTGGACGVGGGSNGMSARDDFFIGYAPPMPAGVARFVRRIVTGLVLAVLAWAAVVASGHVTLQGGTFEFGHPKRFVGTIVERPYPALRPDGAGGHAMAVMLVAPGKYGADALVHGLDGRRVSVTGTAIRRGALTMVEIDPASLVSTDSAASNP